MAECQTRSQQTATSAHSAGSKFGRVDRSESLGTLPDAPLVASLLRPCIRSRTTGRVVLSKPPDGRRALGAGTEMPLRVIREPPAEILRYRHSHKAPSFCPDRSPWKQLSLKLSHGNQEPKGTNPASRSHACQRGRHAGTLDRAIRRSTLTFRTPGICRRPSDT
jgi:hypothetical protein